MVVAEDPRCVSKVKYEEVLSMNRVLEEDYDKLKEENKILRQKLERCRIKEIKHERISKMHGKNQEIERLSKSHEMIKNELEKTKKQVGDLRKQQSTTNMTTSFNFFANQRQGDRYIATKNRQDERNEIEVKKYWDFYSVPELHLPGAFYSTNVVRDAPHYSKSFLRNQSNASTSK